MMEHFVDEKIVMQFYLEQMDADKIEFFRDREELKAQARAYIEQLITEEKMNNKISIAVKLWKVLFEAAMTFINPDKSGYDKLFKYFDAYVEFEELIFASDSFYRDHTLHCIWVYFLGEYLKRRDEFKELFVDIESEILPLDVIAELFELSGYEEKEPRMYYIFKVMENTLKSLNEKDAAIRCIAALTHDLGYPLKKIEKINKSMKKVLPFFSVSNFADFSFEYGNIQQEFVKQFIDFLSRDNQFNISLSNEKGIELLKKMLQFNEIGAAVGINHEVIQALSEEEVQSVLDSVSYSQSYDAPISRAMGFWNDFEEYRHGIMSAFLLCKNVRAFQRIDYDMMENELRYNHIEEMESMLAVNTILSSIANHTSEQFRITAMKTENFLTFVDELEEFSRISRASQNREYVEEFCDTALYMKDGWLNIDFEFNNTNLDNLDPEISFKGRCKRFLTLFDVRKLSPNLKLRVRCIGKLPTDSNVYCLEIAKNHADVLVNGESVNIPKYLKATQFYTKEEYAR